MNQNIKQKIIKDGDDNKIQEVVVFSNQAYLKREVSTQTQAGFNRFLIELKAFSIDADSVQAKVYGHGEILAVQYKEVPSIDAQQQDVKQLEQQLRDLERQKRVIERELNSYKQQKKFLDSTVDYGKVQIPVELKTQMPDCENLQQIVHFLAQNYAELAEKEEKLICRLEDLNLQLNAIQNQLKQAKRPNVKTSKTIEVLFNTQQNEAIKIEVFYVALQAFWKPIYKVDVSLDLSQLSITMFAQIEQKTGEHWNNVQLHVSNALPLKGSRLPEASSWKIYSATPPSYVTARNSSESEFFGAVAAGAAVSEEEALVLEDVLEEAEFSTATETVLPLAFEYQLLQKIDMNSGAGESLLPMFTKPIKGEFFYYSVPKQDVLVYLVCEAELETTLLAGQLNIYFAGRFIGSSFLSEKKAGESLLLNLGVDREVKTQREKITDKLAESFLGGMVDRLSIVRELEFCIVAENLKQDEIRLKIIDAVPISKSDKIQVKDICLKPEPLVTDWQQKKGVMLWDLKLAPQQTHKIYSHFFVKHPKDSPIVL